MTRYARIIVTHPWVIIGAISVITAILGSFAIHARIDSSVDAFVDADDPDKKFHDDVLQTFGSEEVDVVAVVTDDIFNPATLAKIKRLSDDLERIDGVAKVTSLATERDLTVTKDGDIDNSPLMDEPPQDTEGIERLKKAVYNLPIFVGNIVAADGTAAAVVITYEKMSDAAFAASGIHERVERLIDRYRGPERIYLAGIPTLKVKSSQYLSHDVVRFAPITMLVISLVLLLAFQTLRGVLLPVVTTGIGVLWTVGLMAYFDVPIDIGTIVLPTLLIAVGSAYSTHIVSRYYEECEVGGDAREIAARAIQHLSGPVLVTALTTVLGFASLIVYRVRAIRHLGIFSVFGVTALFVLALVFTTALLALLRVQHRRGSMNTDGPGLARFLPALGRFDIRHRKAVIAIAVVLLGYFAWGARYVRVDTSYLHYFPDGSRIREADTMVTDHLAGAQAFLVVVDGPGEDSVRRVDTLRRMSALQDFIERLPGVDKTTSLADYVKLLHRVFHDNDPAYFALPDTDAAVQQYMLLLDPERVEEVANFDYSRGAIVVRSQFTGSSELADVIEKIRRFGADAFPSEFSVRPTGASILLNQTADDLARGQLNSVFTALALVFAVLSLHFLSFRFGMVAMGPNVIPIVMFFGLLGWTGTTLSVSTAVVASIALGIGVDDAVHFLAEFNHEVRKDPDQERAVLAAMQTVGPPAIYTTVALFLGFLVPVWSGFVPVRQFGLLSAFSVVPSLMADLILLPALLVSTRFVTLWDVLRVRLGGAPHETIPLFRGLRPSQARVAVLMGILKTVETGTKIVARGDASDQMYVIIRGGAEVRANAEDRIIALGSVRRGDVIGEMGLLRRRPRTADVVAIEETELLVVDERFLTVLHRRYPRIASTVLLNLTRILSDRLQRADELLAPDSERRQAP